MPPMALTIQPSRMISGLAGGGGRRPVLVRPLPVRRPRREDWCGYTSAMAGALEERGVAEAVADPLLEGVEVPGHDEALV